ncbi:hypothetical protein [Massilia agri]|uniref:Uncharacterized protein n=1 Tax=Massilia agri TaxID=1886785 RepID=A0ABT2AFG3_9BURK|nr:hypothetical protein [Massilia agri]MCS0594962.1 hypothetical protein [Massilia agri]
MHAGHPIHTLELHVREAGQLFNSLDPSPFLNKDLDRTCEAYIESWALALPHESRLHLSIRVERLDSAEQTSELLSEAIHNYYGYKTELVRSELRQLLRQGRTSLAIGLAFVCACLLLAELAVTVMTGPARSIIRESLTIIGWVAMWRPVQIFLYDWWPLKGRIRVFDNLSFARITVVQA